MKGRYRAGTYERYGYALRAYQRGLEYYRWWDRKVNQLRRRVNS